MLKYFYNADLHITLHVNLHRKTVFFLQSYSMVFYINAEMCVLCLDLTAFITTFTQRQLNIHRSPHIYHFENKQVVK